MPRWLLTLPAVSLAVALAPPAPAADPGLLPLIPKEAGLVVAVEHPRKLAEAARDLEAYRSAERALPAVREALDGTPARRFFQFVRFAEKELGATWPDLIDRLAGGGVVLGVGYGREPNPALLAARGTDEKTVADGFRMLARVLDEEAARQGNPAGAVKRGEYKGADTLRASDDFFAARLGAVTYLANSKESLQAGLDLAASGDSGMSLASKPGPAAARTLVDGDPLAWLWFDFAAVKGTKQGKDFFANTRKDLLQTLVFGGTIDALSRADFVVAGLHQTPGGFALSVKVPAARAGLSPDLAVHAPPAGPPGSLPLLEPKGVVYSQSFYLDLAAYWRDRAKLINAQQLKDVEKGERDASRLLPGATLGQLFEMSGPYHRVVVAHRDGMPYKTEPATPIPPVAVVSSFRDPKFGRSAAAALRAAGLLEALSAGLTLHEEEHDGVAVVSYRFPENRPLPGDAENARFNAVPCFAVVDDFLVTSSRPELIRDLIPELRKPTGKPSAAVWRGKAYAGGVADLIRAFPDQTVTATVLAEGAGLDDARKQVAALVKWIDTLGTVELSLDHAADAFEVRLDWKTR